MEAIAASTAQNDSGCFQLDFRDEKYLPFEGAGAVSTWRIELPRKFRAFDYDTISDVILHLRYTARRDEILAATAVDALQAELDAADGAILFRFFSLRHEFPNEWHMLRTSENRTATFTIPKGRFPLLAQQGSVTVKEVHSALILKEPRPAVAYKATLTQAAAAPMNLEWLAKSGRYRGAAKAEAVTIPISTVPADSGWTLELTQPALQQDLDKIQDILIVVNYSVTM